ncbi:MAG: hypothetical protein U0324_47050 [Polyangiales bacterium]
MRLRTVLGAAALLLAPRPARADDDPEPPAAPAPPSPRTPLEVGLLLGHLEGLSSGSDPFGATFAARVAVRPRATPLFLRAGYLFGLGAPPPSATRAGRHAHTLLSEVGLAFGRRVEGRFALGVGLLVEQRTSRLKLNVATSASAGVAVHLGPWLLSAEFLTTLGFGADAYFALGGLGGLAYTFE